jgi:hypothetical protein
MLTLPGQWLDDIGWKFQTALRMDGAYTRPYSGWLLSKSLRRTGAHIGALQTVAKLLETVAYFKF